MFPVLVPDPVGQPAIGARAPAAVPGNASGRKGAASHVPLDRSSSRMHLDLVLPREHERRGASPRRVRRASPIGLPCRGVGAAQNRRRSAAHHVSPWVADALSRRPRYSSTERQLGRKLCYSAGAMVLSKEHPNRIVYRSPEPVLVPEGPAGDVTERSTTSCFPPASIVGMILARPIASTSTMAWPMIGLAWRVWTCPQRCRAT